MRKPLGRALLVTALATVGLGAATTAPAAADGPGVGAPWIVSVGDSAISGEAGRWAGNTNDEPSRVDALGATAYYDNGSNTGEAIVGCHRSKSAEVFIGGGVNGKNFACSGARTYTQDPSDGDFKPGLDFYNNGAGKKGQALALQEFAGTRNVKAVVVLIGANNYHFADIVQTCVLDWYFSPSWWPDYCSDDSDIVANFTSSNIAAQTAAIKSGLLNVRQAMRNAGYADSMWTLIVQTYSSPIPRGSGFRYGQSGYTRQTVGGCGVWNRDADWANDTVVATLNSSVKNAAAQSGITNYRILDNRERARGAAPVREHGGPARGEGCRGVDERRRRRQDRVGEPDPHVVHDRRAVPAPGGSAPELLGAARPAELPAPRLQRRRAERRHVPHPEHRAQLAGRAEDDPAVAALGASLPICRITSHR